MKVHIGFRNHASMMQRKEKMAEEEPDVANRLADYLGVWNREGDPEDTAFVDEVRALMVENTAYIKTLADVFDDMECLPTCDSYGHDDECPAVYGDKAFSRLRKQLAEAEKRIAERDDRIRRLGTVVDGLRVEHDLLAAKMEEMRYL